MNAPSPTAQDGNAGDRVLYTTERAAVDSAPWFSELSPALRHDILRRVRVMRLKDREAICWQGQRASAWLAVASGSVRLGMLAHGQELTICYLEPGTWFGEEAICRDGHYAHDAYASGSTTILRVETAALQEILGEHPELQGALLQLQLKRMRQMTELFAEQATLPLRVRLARHLTRLATTFGTPTSASETLIQLQFPQKELGMLVGASRQRVNQELRELERNDLIRIEACRLIIRDAEALQERAEELSE